MLSKSIFLVSALSASFAGAALKPGKVHLNRGASVVATYTNFYNDSDLRATCVVYTDGTGMLIADGIVPYRKPKGFRLSQAELKSLKAIAAAETRRLASPEYFVGFNAIACGSEETSSKALGAAYFGTRGDLRQGADIANIPTEKPTALEKKMRALCGYGDEL